MVLTRRFDAKAVALQRTADNKFYRRNIDRADELTGRHPGQPAPISMSRKQAYLLARSTLG